MSNTIVCGDTLTKKPLTKTTPSAILAIDERPTGVSPDCLTLNSLLFDAEDDTPEAFRVTSLISSDALNLCDGFVVAVPSVPCCRYLTIRVSGSVVVWATVVITSPITPDVSPLYNLPTELDKYVVTSVVPDVLGFVASTLTNSTSISMSV